MGKQHTKDENYLLCLYEEAQKGSDLEQSFDRYEIGNKCRLYPKAVDTICKLLVQANFVKKSSEEMIYLTPHGQKLAERLLSEKGS